MTEAKALLELLDLTQAASYPVLPEAEAKRILRRHCRGLIWSAGASVVYGQRVVPLVGNGRVYRCTRPGVTYDTEPEWPVWGSRFAPARWGGIVDNTVVWEDAGPAPAQLWDFEAAAFDGWMAKAGKVAGKYDFKDAGQTLTRSQMYEHCVAQAGLHLPAFIF